MSADAGDLDYYYYSYFSRFFDPPSLSLSNRNEQCRSQSWEKGEKGIRYWMRDYKVAKKERRGGGFSQDPLLEMKLD